MTDSGKGNVKFLANGKEGSISVDGNFAFHIQSDFRNAYESLVKTCNHIKVNLDKTDYMDSSGLGMLLVMKKFFDGERVTYEIVGSRGQTLDLLKLTRFDKYFKINGQGS